MTNNQKQIINIIIISIVISSLFGFLAGEIAVKLLKSEVGLPTPQTSQTLSAQILSQEQAVIKVVKEASSAVVSIIASKDLPIIEQYFKEYSPFEEFFKEEPFSQFFPFKFRIPEYRQKGTERREIGGGTGFMVSSDGLILTNKHVVEIEGADYTVLTNEGERYQARVLALDPVQDIAILKIDKKNLPTVQLGNSDNLEIGQTVIAIGNALGEFRNTVSVGVISGLGRSITATSPTGLEFLENVIQTDAAINRGNSGGPLLNLSGEVIGINLAMASGAENIGFALPINLAKRDIEQVKHQGKISYPFLGIRYTLITPSLKEKNNLLVDYGALIVRGEKPEDLAIIPDSPADKAGLEENDIILEVDNEKITPDHSLAKIIQSHNVGDTIILKVLSKGQEKIIKVTLGER